MTSVLVTGATGFIGRHLVTRLLHDGASVHALVRPNLAPPPDGTAHAADLLDPVRTRAVVAAVRPAVVYHLAGRVDLTRSAPGARACIEENLTATVNLLDALQESPPGRLVYVSSTEVYGSNTPPFREDQRVDPPSPYAVTKVAAEEFCRLYGRATGVEVCVLRLAPAYGPGQGAARFLPSLILACLRGEPVRVRHPQQRRDHVYVADLAEGIARAGAAALGPFEIINLGSEETWSLAEIAEEVVRVAGRPVTVERGNKPLPNEAAHWATCADKARRLLDWKPRTDLAAGLAATLAWYRERARP